MVSRVSLKAKVGMDDLERLLRDVRQHVEFAHPVSVSREEVNGGSATSSSPGRRIRFVFRSFLSSVAYCVVPASSRL